MADSTSVGLVRGLYDYHWWANHRLFGVARALGEETARRDVGKQFSFPTLKGMFAHICAADSLWLSRWQGVPTGRLMGDADFATLAELRSRWDRLEAEQKTFVDGLTSADLDRVVSYKNTEGRALAGPLWRYLQHVPNHATHHRSEIATMLTMISGSPSDSGIATYVSETAGR
jgi:uncharacterized damage-inducible protein DinB